MKTSKIIIFLIVIVLGVGLVKILIIYNIPFSKYYGNSFYYDDYDEQIRRMNEYKRTDQIKIGLICIGICILLLGIYSKIKKGEDKIDPIKSLQSLKNKSIISNEEFNFKMDELKTIEIENFNNLKKKKEKDKIILDLENLKQKGILTEEEFNIKVKLLEK